MSQVKKAIIAFIITFILLSCCFSAKEASNENNNTNSVKEADKQTDKKNDTVATSSKYSFPTVKFPAKGTRHQVFLDNKYELMKQILTEYENNSIDNRETKEITSKAIKDYLDRIHNKQIITKQHIVSLCKSITKTKPKDPLSKAFIQYYLRDFSYTKLENIDHYSPFVQMYIELITAYYIKHPTYKKTVEEFTSQQHTNPRAYWWMLTKLDLSHSDKQIKKINTILEENTSSWVQKMGLGIKHFYLSGRERDGQFHPKGFNKEKYYTHSSEAIKHFEQAYKDNPRLPEPTQYLIDLHFDIHKQTYWLNKALEIEIDNPSAFYNFIWLTESTSDHTTKNDSLMYLADECMKNRAKSELIPLYALDVIYKIYLQKQVDQKIIQINELDQKIISYFSKNHDITLPNTKDQYYRSILLLMFINTNQFDAINQFENLIETGEINWKIVDKDIKDFEFYKSLPSLNESPNKQEINQLLSRYFEDFTPANSKAIIDVSREDYQLILDIQKNNKIKGLQPVLNYMNNFLEFQYTLHSGEWLNIDFVKHRPFYTPYNDNYKIESANAFRIDSNKIFYITFPKGLPQNLEIEYDFEHVSNNRSRFSLFGFSVYSKNAEKKMSLLADLHAATAYIYIPNKDWKWSPFVPKRSDKNANVKIKLWPNMFQYNFNNGDYFYCTENGVPDIGKIRFGTRFTSSAPGTFILKNLRVRKHSTPAIQDDSPEGYEKYYGGISDLNKVAGVKAFLANYYMQEKKYEKSLSLYKEAMKEKATSSTAMQMADVLLKLKKYSDVANAYLQAYLIGDHPVLKSRAVNLYFDTVAQHPNPKLLEEAHAQLNVMFKHKKSDSERFKMLIQKSKLEATSNNMEELKKNLKELDQLAKQKHQKNQLKNLKKFIKKLKPINQAA